MEVLWKQGEQSAGQLAKTLKASIGWNRNTTYTVIKKCIEKGAIERTEPNFICSPLLTRNEIQQAEANELMDKMFDGSAEQFFVAMLGDKKLDQREIENLKRIVNELE